MKNMPYRLCLFDIDGTLTDPKPGIVGAYQYALGLFGVREEPEQLTKFIGPPLREVFRDFYNFTEPDVEKAVAGFREYYAKAGLYENSVYPGIPETLQALADDGRVLAVATNKTKVVAEFTLKHFGLDSYFAFVSGDKFDGSLSKNGKRDIIRVALDALDPGREIAAVMIGDRKHDITGAAGNGIDSIGITWGYGPQAELADAGATWIVKSQEELLSLIKKS